MKSETRAVRNLLTYALVFGLGVAATFFYLHHTLVLAATEEVIILATPLPQVMPNMMAESIMLASMNMMKSTCPDYRARTPQTRRLTT